MKKFVTLAVLTQYTSMMDGWTPNDSKDCAMHNFTLQKWKIRLPVNKKWLKKLRNQPEHNNMSQTRVVQNITEIS